MTDSPIRAETTDADTGHADKPIFDILCVREALGQVSFLIIAYYAGDEDKAAGYVFRRKAASEEPAQNILATNDTLRTLWCSPSGHLWLSSTTGMVWTTAPVPWPSTVSEPDLEYEVPEGDLVWRHTTLPPQAHNGLRPNGWDLWGTSDGDVYLGTFGGVIYHWDGASWSQYFSGAGNPIGCIRGRAPDDVYAVGYHSTILHFDGSAWNAIADPDGPDHFEPLTGVAFAGDDVYICGGRSGRLLRGDASGFSVVGRHDVRFMGAVNVNGRLIFGARDVGVVEVTDQGLVVLRDDIDPLSVAEGKDHVYFTEMSRAGASYRELHLASGQWRSLTH